MFVPLHRTHGEGAWLSICWYAMAPSSTGPGRRGIAPMWACGTARSPSSDVRPRVPRRTIDAEGHVVAPGFVDGHTHMDAQVFWDPIGSCSCYHGVTSVVMGNCGFTLAPCRESEADLVFRNLERAEDISREAMLAGINWRWETYPEYLDVLDALPKGINYAGYMGHSALRTYVMGQRAFEEEATEDEIRTMANLAQEAVRAGAMGFTTSRSPNHETSDRRPVASRQASWQEVRAIVNAVGETGAGMFEIAGEAVGRDPERIREYHDRLKGAGGRVRRSHHLGHVREPQGTGSVAPLLRASRRSGRGRRAHVRAGAFSLPQRAVLVRGAPAVR